MCRTKSKAKTKTRSGVLDDTSRQGLPKLLRHALSKADLRPGRRRIDPSQTSPGATSKQLQDPFFDQGIAATEDACSDTMTTPSIESFYSGTQDYRSTESNGRCRPFKSSLSPTQASRETTATAQTLRAGHATVGPLLLHPNTRGQPASYLPSLGPYRRGGGLQDTRWDMADPSDGNTHTRERASADATPLPIAVGIESRATKDTFLESSRAASTTDLPFRYTLLSGEGRDGLPSTDPSDEEADDLLRLDVPYWTEDGESGRFYHWDTDCGQMTWYPEEFD